MARATRLLIWILGGGVLLVALLAAGLALLIESRPGHDLFLRMALRQLPRYVNGEVVIGGLHSEGLLRGFTLRGVAIRDAEGRPFIEADSLRVGYSALGLLKRELILVPMDSWGLRVTVETLHGDTLSNAQRIFPASDSEQESTASPGFTLVLRDVAIMGGEFVLRMPRAADAENVPIGVVETLPDLGGEYLTLRFSGIDGILDEATVLDPGGDGSRYAFNRLSLDAYLRETPLRLAEFRGEISIEGPLISITADRLWFPGSELAGEVVLDLSDSERGVRIDATLEAAVLRLADLHWFEPRLPEGEGALTFSFQGYPEDGELQLSTSDFQTERSRVRGSFGMNLGTGAILPGSEVELLALDLEEITGWAEEWPTFAGHLSGRIRGVGELNALRVDGVLAYEDPARGIPSTTVSFAGGLRLGENPGFSNFSFVADPLDYATLRAALPESEIAGSGRVSGTLSGRLVSGVTVAAEIEHSLPEFPASLLRVAGTVSRPREDFVVDLQGTVDPLSLDGLAAALGIELPASGQISGDVLARGTARDLSLTVALTASAGSVAGEAEINLLDPAGRYHFEGEVEDFLLHALLPGIPDSTRVSGAIVLDGRGRTVETIDALASLNLRDSKVAGVDLDSLTIRLQASGGMLRVEELEVMAPLLRLSGTGTLPMIDELPEGEILIVWEAASLDVLQPLIFGTEPISADTLSALEREVLRLSGVDFDTIDTGGRSRLEGSARGELRLAGRTVDLSGTGFAEISELVYGKTELASARADFVGSWNRDREWAGEGVFDLEGIASHGFTFERGGGEVRLRPGGGDFAFHLDKTTEESFMVEGEVSHDSIATVVEFRSLVLSLEDATWALLEPARVRWADSTFAVESFRLARPPGVVGGEAVLIEAHGAMGGSGENILRIEASQLELARIETILQREDIPEGVLDLVVDIGGQFESPTIAGTFIVRELEANEAGLTTLEGEVDYRDQRLNLRIEGEVDGDPLLSLVGYLPLDLAFRGVTGDRLLDREMDLTLSIRELPAAMVAVLVQGIEEVEGTLAGEVRFGGTPRDFRPNGQVALRDGSLLLPEMGVRPSAISADFRLQEDGTLEVDARAMSPGMLSVTGTIALSNLRDPGFSLAVEADRFQAVQRRDLSARIGGSVVLTGSYSAPQVSGSVRVEEGAMFLEEFARSAEVVNLSDPFVVDLVDTTLVSINPVVAAAQNPFIQNLFVQVDMEIGRDFWLRSREMDVEMGGALLVTFDRPKREIVMAGSLVATRGNYTTFGRQFQVVSGSVDFAGTPGINPELNIQAITRFRRPGGEPLNITANVEGTLMSPTVILSSDAQPAIAESDLISYLIFGRPSYALASGESSALAGAAGAGLNLGIGTLASQVGSVVAREIGLDYFTITQDQEGAGLESVAGLSSTFGGTQIEMGQYLRENLFLAFVLRPVSGVGSGSRLPGARLEWTFADDWSMEGFVEDRFAREGASGFGELGLRLSKVFGMSLFREWGY